MEAAEKEPVKDVIEGAKEAVVGTPLRGLGGRHNHAQAG